MRCASRKSLWLVLAAALLASVGCAESRTAAPDAQATAVRRAEIAEVQRIIAGNVNPTPIPQPTPTQLPACVGALWWYEARDHVGESRVIQGPVVRSRPGPGASVWLEIGQAYPDPTGLPILVLASAGDNLIGKTICVDGRIANSNGAPQIDARGAARIVVVN